MSRSEVCLHSTLTSTILAANPETDGRQERVQFDKITARVSRLCYGLDTDHVDPVAITQKVISGVYGGVTTVQLDDLVSIAFTPWDNGMQ
jgi:hypothetical protein